MNITRVRALFTLFSIILCFVLSASVSGDENDGKYLKWQDVEGASYYVVEIKKGERLVQSIETTESAIPLDLLPGQYTYRIAVFNKFRKLVGESGWRELAIETETQPFIRKYEPLSVYLEDKPIVLRITAFNIAGDTTFSLVSGDKKYAGNVISSDNNVYEVEFPADEVPEGEYSVYAETLSGMKDTALEILKITVPRKPVIKQLGDGAFESGAVYRGVEVRGENLEKGMIIELRNNGRVISPLSVDFISPENVNLILDLTGTAPGEYQIYAENPSGLSDTFKNRLEITEGSYSAALSGGAAGSLKKKFTLHGGVSYGYMLENFSDYHNYNYSGVTARLQMDFDNSFFNRYAWLAPFGGELVFDFYPKDIDLYEAGINIYYKSRFSTPFNFILRSGAGLSFFEKIDEGPDYGIFMQGTAGLAINLFGSLYMDFSTGPKIWLVNTDYLNYLISSATAGFSY